ncbi:alpha-1,6-mannosylglycoprotein 6-beta-N-acetylglucosaminyltransferase A, partial [Tachysurus ichikawai]
LKKTLAVLLDNIMLRLSKLESKVDTINVVNGTASNQTNSTVAPAPSSANGEKVNVA